MGIFAGAIDYFQRAGLVCGRFCYVRLPLSL